MEMVNGTSSKTCQQNAESFHSKFIALCSGVGIFYILKNNQELKAYFVWSVNSTFAMPDQEIENFLKQ